MTSETIPCPRCSRPTPPERDDCRHCGEAIVANRDAGGHPARKVLFAVGAMSTLLATVGWLYAAYLGWIQSPRAASVIPSAFAWLVIATGCALAYRRLHDTDSTDDA